MAIVAAILPLKNDFFKGSKKNIQTNGSIKNIYFAAIKQEANET